MGLRFTAQLLRKRFTDKLHFILLSSLVVQHFGIVHAELNLPETETTRSKEVQEVIDQYQFRETLVGVHGSTFVFCAIMAHSVNVALLYLSSDLIFTIILMLTLGDMGNSIFRETLNQQVGFFVFIFLGFTVL